MIFLSCFAREHRPQVAYIDGPQQVLVKASQARAIVELIETNRCKCPEVFPHEARHSEDGGFQGYGRLECHGTSMASKPNQAMAHRFEEDGIPLRSAHLLSRH